MTKITQKKMKERNTSAKRQDAEASVKSTANDGWSNLLTGLGQTGRDKNKATTFCMDRRFGPSELDQIYRSDGMTRRVIDLVAEEMVRQGWDIENDPKGMIQVKLDELKINSVMMDMLRWSRLYGGSLGVIGIADGRPLEEPVNMNAVNDVKWIHVFDRFSVSSADGRINDDMNSPNYGKPNAYLVTDSRTGTSFVVHHSRTIRCDWNELTPRWVMDNDTWGDPLMQTIYEELKNYSSAFANCGVIIHDFVNYVLKIPGLAGLLASDGCSNQVQN
jgi:phage-related protein (TIGR01555 family)